MNKNRLYTAAVAVTLAMMACVSFAQQPSSVRIRAQIEKFEGNVLMVKARDGANLKLVTPDNVRVAAMVKAELSELKPDTYIGVTAMPQADGSQKAIAVHIFQPSQRGTGEGFRTLGPDPWQHDDECRD